MKHFIGINALSIPLYGIKDKLIVILDNKWVYYLSIPLYGIIIATLCPYVHLVSILSIPLYGIERARIEAKKLVRASFLFPYMGFRPSIPSTHTEPKKESFYSLIWDC